MKGLWGGGRQIKAHPPKLAGAEQSWGGWVLHQRYSTLSVSRQCHKCGIGFLWLDLDSTLNLDTHVDIFLVPSVDLSVGNQGKKFSSLWRLHFKRQPFRQDIWGLHVHWMSNLHEWESHVKLGSGFFPYFHSPYLVLVRLVPAGLGPELLSAPPQECWHP